MKNRFKLFGIIALAALIGFAMISCNSSSSDTYSTAIFMLGDDDYVGVFGGLAPIEGELIMHSGSRAELYAKAEAAFAFAGPGDVMEVGEDTLFSEIEDRLQELVVLGALTNQQKTQMLDEIKNRGYGVGAVPGNPGKTVVFAAFIN